MPGACVFSSSSDESDCNSDFSEEGPAYSIISDDEVPDFDDTISVGSQDDTPELLTVEPPPSANNEETMLFTVPTFLLVVQL